MKGHILSFVLFNSKALNKLSVDDWQQLESLNFPCSNSRLQYQSQVAHAPGVVEEVAEELPDYLRPFPGPADTDLMEEPLPPLPEEPTSVLGKRRFEDEAFDFERDHVEQDQLLKVLKELGLPEVEEQTTRFKVQAN